MFRLNPRFRPLQVLSRNTAMTFKSHPSTQLSNSHPHSILPCLLIRYFRHRNSHHSRTDHHEFVNSDGNSTTDNEAINLKNVLKTEGNKPAFEIERALTQCKPTVTEDLVLNVLRRHRFDWKPAYTFFNWVSKDGRGSGYSPGSDVFNEILDILGRMKRFKEVHQLLDEMSQRKGTIDETTFGIVLNRYAAAHKVDETIELFYKRKEFGLGIDLAAFQTLLLSLCRYKHVEAAETLYHTKKNEFRPETKTMNIILNGWCVLGNLREAKRVWKDIFASECKPNRFTYGIFVHALTKNGKINTALKLFRAMWKEGSNPDVAICNCIIDGLCFKKRIPEALEIFNQMSERECLPNAATYNSLIKHLCKIQRMNKVYELLNEMEQKGEGCSPNARTYVYLLKYTKKPEEVFEILERMKRSGCKMNSDMYNMVLRLFMDWDSQERVKSTWVEMEKSGLGPDRRSYTIMIHGLYDKGRMEDALYYFNEMTSKGMIPEPRTEGLVKAINVKAQDGGS